MAEAGTGGYPAEPRIGEHGDVLAMRKIFERRGNLIDLLHACTGRASADQHDDVAFADAPAFDGVDCGSLCDEDLRRASMPVDIAFIDERRIDGSALDD